MIEKQHQLPFVPGVRNAVRAVVIRDGKVLLLQKRDHKGDRYALPGGGQDVGETLEQALQRECKEEIGTAVIVKRLAYVAEFFKHRDSLPATVRHLVEFLFQCEVPEGYQPGSGFRPDKHQVDVVWAPMAELKALPSFPQQVALPFVDDSPGLYQGLLNGS